MKVAKIDSRNRYIKQRHIRQFVKVGRTGSQYFLFGAPGKLVGPYNSAQEAEAALTDILDNCEDYQIVNRQVVKKEQKKVPKK